MSLQELQALGWVPGANPPPAPPPGLMASAAATPAAPYRPIGAAPADASWVGGYGPSTNPGDSQAAADAALQASLTDGGKVAPKGGAIAGAPTALPPGPGAGVATKAGMRPNTESVEIKGGVPVTPELAASQQAVRDTSAGVDQAQTALAAVSPIETKARTQEEAIHEGQLADQEAQRQKDYASELANESWKRDKAHAAFELAASKGTDSNAYWKNKSTGGTIATALELMAGGFASGFAGKPNAALEQVNKAIDRDIADQREAIEGKKGVSDAADTHMGLFVKEGLDKQQAAAAATVLARQQFAKQLDAKYTATSNALGKLTLQQAMQKNAVDLAKAEQEYGKTTADTVTRKVDEKYQPATGGGEGNIRQKVIDQAGKWVSEGKYASIDEAMRAAGHLYGFDPSGAAPVTDAAAKAGTDKLSPRLVKTMAELDEQEQAAVRLDKLLDSGSSLSPSDRSEAEALATQLRNGGYTNIDEHPLRTFDATSASRKGVQQVLRGIRTKRSSILEGGKGSGAAPDDAAP